MTLTEAGATALSAGIGFGSSVAGGFLGGLFNANQAKKNRAFQERMYDKQVEDNIKFWNMQNEYNLPSAQLQRLRDAGLNPLLMYGEGGVQNVANSAVQSGQAPSGAQASTNFNTRVDFANLALLHAQIKNMEADTQQKLASAEDTKAHQSWQELETKWNRESYNIRLALQHGEYDKVRSEIRSLDGHLLNDTHLTMEQCRTMAQARIYEIKRFDLDADTIGTQLQQRWKEIANGTISANAQLKAACAQMLQAQVAVNLSEWQIGEMAQNILFNWKANPLKLQNMKLQNFLNSADLSNKQMDYLNKLQKNINLFHFGAEQISGNVAPLFLISGRLSGRINR